MKLQTFVIISVVLLAFGVTLHNFHHDVYAKGAVCSPSASAGRFGSNASVGVGVRNLQAHSKHDTYEGKADVYAAVASETLKQTDVDIFVTIGEMEITIIGIFTKRTVTRSYIADDEDASQGNFGWPWQTKWALAKGNLGDHDPPDAHDEYLHNFTSS